MNCAASFAVLLTLGQQTELTPAQQTIERLIEAGTNANQQKRYADQQKAFAEAVQLGRESGWKLAESLNGLGSAEWRLGNLDAAKSHLTEAVALWPDENDRAASQSNLGMVLDQLGEYEAAARAYQEAYPAFRGNKLQQAILINNVARLYASLGDLDAAANSYGQSAAILRTIPDGPRTAQALANLGAVKVKSGDAASARVTLTEALTLADPGSAVEADARNYLGRALAGLGDLTEALDQLERSTAIAQSLKDQTREARAHHEAGLVLHAQGESAQALERLAKAKAIRERQGATSALADTIASMAEIRLDLREPELARVEIEDAIARVEAIRTGVPQEQLRATYFASKQRYYETWVESLVKLHEQKPGAGFDALAFRAAEQARARTLLDLLRAGTGEVRVGINPALLAEQKRLLVRIRALSRQPNPGEELQRAQGELLELEMRIRKASPSYAAIVDPRIATVTDVAALLDEETVLVKYWLGARRSFRWAIFHDGRAELLVLPPRAEVEARAKQALREPAAATNLGGILFPGAVHAKRVVLVTDGALEYVPFAALTLTDRQPLIAKWEIVQLPSASLLLELRARQPSPRTRALALVTDPVFEPADSRLPKSSGKVAEPLSRLAFSAREGAEIARICGRSSLTPYSGVAARKSLFTDGSLANHTILHVSSHALIDSERPERSSIALSQFDPSGRAVDGMLRLYDLYGMRLDADLVVLSACRTGMGKELRGEGMIGFSRAFFHAGARGLVATLWRVDDEASAELMALFYRNLFSNGLTAPAALRAAQLTLRKDARWRSPYYWAGFTIQGDWSGVPAMVRSSDGARRGRRLSQPTQP